MFGSNSKNSNSKNGKSSAPSGALNSIVTGTNIQGDIVAQSDIRIDGSLHGTLNCKGKLIIGNSGKVEGEVRCENCVIEGTFEGKLNVGGNLTVKEKAKINGDIQTDKLIVKSGAVFNVQCRMGKSEFGKSDGNNPRKTASPRPKTSQKSSNS